MRQRTNNARLEFRINKTTKTEFARACRYNSVTPSECLTIYIQKVIARVESKKRRSNMMSEAQTGALNEVKNDKQIEFKI